VRGGKVENGLMKENEREGEFKNVPVVFLYTFQLISIYCRQCKAKKPLKCHYVNEVFNFGGSCAHLSTLIMFVCADLKHIVSKNQSGFCSNNVHTG